MKKPIKNPFSNIFSIISWLVLAGLVAISIWSSYNLQKERKEQAYSLFEAHRTELTKALSDRIEAYHLVLRAGAGLLRASDNVTPAEWLAFIETINIKDTYPAFHGIGYMAYTGNIPAGPAGAGAELRSEQQAVYYPDKGLPAGDILSTNSDYREALEIAAETGEIVTVEAGDQLSGRLGLATPALVFIMAQSDRSQNLSGFVYGIFLIEKMANSALATMAFDDTQLQIFDSSKKLLFDSHPSGKVLSQNSYVDTFIYSTELASGNYVLPVQLRTLPQFGKHLDSNTPLMILVFGTALSMLTFWIMRLLLSTKQNAEFLARQLTREVESSKARLESILTNLVDGVITIDENGNIQTYNKACEEMFGYTAEEAIGKNVKLLMPEHYAREHDTYLENYRKTGDAKIIGTGRQVEGKRKDGSIFSLDLAVSEIYLGSERIFSGIVRDISERKRAELELRTTNEELEQFAYIASHDLKAPLRGIDNLTQWIEEDLKDLMTSEIQAKLDLMKNRVGRLENLLDDILQYSRAGRIVDEPIEINTRKLIEDIIANIEVPEKFRIDLSNNMPIVLAPYTPLEQIFTNLIINAVKHHDKDSGTITIDAQDRGASYEFMVQDDGPGIPEEFHERVFKMFQTLQSRDKKEGSGLGMAIIKKLVEWQGGRVWIISPDDKRGTAVHFTWPKKLIYVRRKNAG